VTILNALVTTDRVLLCTDTAVVTPDRLLRADQSKIFYLPHANVAMGGRGVQRLTLDLFAGAWMNLIGSLDQLEDAWAPAALDEYFGQLLASARQNGVDLGRSTGSEVLVAGFSHRRNCMIALRYVAQAGGRFVKNVVNGCVIAPNCDLDVIPAMDSITAMAALARRQIAYWTEREPQEAFGGRLVFADLQRDTASFTTYEV
jgi:hypothetical protein